MRVGLSSIDPRPGRESLARVRERIDAAAVDGFPSVWMPTAFGLDALTALATLGPGGMELGTACVPVYPRHPAALAQQALTTQAAVGGRLTLGIGLSHRVMMQDMLGYSFDRPAAYMREYLAVLQPLLEEGTASVDGERVRANVTLTAERVAPPPVLLAALGPRMLALAGACTGGTILAWTGPVAVKDHVVPTLQKAADAAGRPAPRVVCVLPVCVTDDPSGVHEWAAKAFAFYGELPSYQAMAAKEGVDVPADLFIAGDEDAVVERLAAFADAGVTDFVAGEAGRPDELDRTRALLAKLAREEG